MPEPITLVVSGIRLLSKLMECFNRQGRIDEEESLLLHMFEMQLNLLRDKQIDTNMGLTTLASVYQTQKRYKDSEALRLHLLVIQLQSAGNLEQRRNLLNLANMISIHVWLGRFSEAEELILNILEDLESWDEMPFYKFDLAATLATTYTSQGRLKEAENLTISVLDLRLELLGGAHPNTLASLENLVEVYVLQERWIDAEEFAPRRWTFMVSSKDGPTTKRHKPRPCTFRCTKSRLVTKRR